LKANETTLQAIQEGKRVAVYFDTEEQAQKFIQVVKEQKDSELEYLGFDEIDKKSIMLHESHPVIPSQEEKK